MTLEKSDHLSLVISREDIEGKNTKPTLAALASLTQTPETASRFQGRVDIGVAGYDKHRNELFEIIEVRDFIMRLDEGFPYWLFFLSKRGLGLHFVMLCFLPPFLKAEARATIFPKMTADILRSRWLPAMVKMAEFSGLSQPEIKVLSDRVTEYILAGPRH